MPDPFRTWLNTSGSYGDADNTLSIIGISRSTFSSLKSTLKGLNIKLVSPLNRLVSIVVVIIGGDTQFVRNTDQCCLPLLKLREREAIT